MNLSAAHFFGLYLGGCLVLGMWFIYWTAQQYQPQRWPAWIDTYLLTLLGGILAARVGFILTHWAWFDHATGYLPRLWYQELHWQSGLIGGALVGWGLCRLRKIPLAHFLEGLALVLPLGLMGLWWGCRGAGCGIGPALPPTAEYPGLLVSYLINTQGFTAPRYELQSLGAILAWIILILIGGLTWRGQWAQTRFWLALGLVGFSLAPLFYWRSTAAPLTTDLISALILIGIAAGGGWWSSKRRNSVGTASAENRL